MTEVMLTAAVRDLIYLFVGLTAFWLGFRYLVKEMVGSYADIMDKLDNNPVAIGIFLGLLAHAVGGLITAFIHG